jgi:NNP family nitrate/nitrite transporter-like MFS transporter
VYFTTFGGFVALTAWLPTYWASAFGFSVVMAGVLTAVYSLLASSIRIAGGVLADRLYQGGYNTSILALFIMLSGALLMTVAREYELAIPGVVLLAVGMGICNAAVFKVVPQVVPQAVGGAAGWVGGLGRLAGSRSRRHGVRRAGSGDRGYAIGFVVFIFLSLVSLAVAWILSPAWEARIAARPACAVAVARSFGCASSGPVRSHSVQTRTRSLRTRGR